MAPGGRQASSVVVLALALATGIHAGPAAAQAAGGVYRCTGAGGAVAYTDKPCDAAAEPLRVRSTSFGGAASGAAMSVQRTSCQATGSGRYATAGGEVVNNTGEVRRATVTAVFMSRGAVVDTVPKTVVVEPFGRFPYTLVGGPGTIDQCSYRLAWE
jgi:hypothetical protein